jgi:hypothetical protein
MQEYETPFNWAMVRDYIEGANFQFTSKFNVIMTNDFECLMAIRSVDHMCEIRDWLQDEIHEGYTKLGRFCVAQTPRAKIVTRCIGVRFVFHNVLDLNYFRMSCHSGMTVGDD